MLAALARQVVEALRQHHPLIELHEAVAIAQKVCAFQLDHAPELLQQYADKAHTHWGFALVQTRGLIGAPRRGLQVQGPMRLENCKTDDEVMQSATTLALLHDPVTRALLHKCGFDISFITGDPQTPSNDPTEA